MRHKHLGFTLIEILVALFIFALLSAMMAEGLHRLLRVQSGLQNKSRQLREDQTAFLYLNHDISQAVYRPITLPHGQEALAFTGRINAFELTRLGAADEGVMQSNLQRVEYHFENHQMVRWVWPAVDPVESAKVSRRILLQHVKLIRLAYLDKRGKAHRGWPLQADTSQPLPRAVSMTLQLESQGEITQTFLLAAENTGWELSHAD